MVRRIPRPIARAPIWLYRHHFGWLLGGRFALLEHRGRITRLPRNVVLEVLSRRPGHLTVVSGYGPASQWYQNILADPHVRVWSGRWRAAPARATPLPPDVALALLSDYRRHHPHLTRLLGRALEIPELAGSRPLPHDLPARLPLVDVALASAEAAGR